MKLNYQTALIGPKVILVPYRPEHVEKYHNWMQSPFLLEMTASEPLSIQEEIEMQLSWKNDDNKCTFIILARCACARVPSCQSWIKDIEERAGNNNNELLCEGKDKDLFEFNFIKESLGAMIGDVNLFLSEIESDEKDGDSTNKSASNDGIQAELDIMIAEEQFRKMGMGKEATIIMMLYGARKLNIRRYIVKIKEDNLASRQMFEMLGFNECNYAACFKEYEYDFTFSTSEEMAMAIQETYQIPICLSHIPDENET